MTSNAGTLRLFVAVLMPESWVAALTDAQDALRRAGLRLRYVRPEGIHLTLKFLGEVESERLHTVTAALDRPPATLRPFRLELDALGTFGASRRPRVLWAGLRGDQAALAGLAADVDSALVPAGFARESRPFRPHLTLARVPESMPVEDALRIVPAVAAITISRVEPLHVTSYALVRSDLGPGGARYTTLQTWTIADATAP